MRNDPIGIFDSGAGGLNVLEKCRQIMPRERYIYLADYANMPYGEKPREKIISCALDCVKTLFDKNCKAVLVACNTATATAINALREKYPDRIIVGLEPAVKPCLRELGRYGRALAIVTPATFVSQRFNDLIAQSGGSIIPVPAPDLAALIERSLSTDDGALGEYVTELLSEYKGVKAVVLGCSHYSYATPQIKRVLGDVRIYDGAEGAAKRMLYCLQIAGLLCDSGNGGVEYIDTGKR